MLLSEYIVDIEKPDEICALTFVVNEFLGIFFLSLNLFIKHSRSS